MRIAPGDTIKGGDTKAKNSKIYREKLEGGANRKFEGGGGGANRKLEGG